MTDKKNKLDTTIGVIIVIIFAISSLIGLSFFERMETRFYDLSAAFTATDYQHSDNIAIIEIDDKSLGEFGSWPWPRHVMAEMIDLLNESGARLIGLNILFAEEETNEGLKEIRAFREKYNAYPLSNKDTSLKDWVLENLDQIEGRLDNDASIVESVRGDKNIILPVSGKSLSYRKNNEDMDVSLFASNSLDSSSISPSFKESISLEEIAYPFSELARNAAGLGHNELISGTLMGGRSHPIYLYYKNSLLPSLPLRLAIAYLNQQPGQVLAEENQIIINGRSIPLTGGEMLIKFSHQEDAFQKFSFFDVLNNKQEASGLKDKLVLIGFNHYESRRIETPVSYDMAEPEFAAHVLENIISFNSIVRPFYMPYVEILILFIIGIFGTLFLHGKGQLARLIWLAGIIILILITGIILFSMMGIWFKPVCIISCLIILYLYFSAKDLLLSTEYARESHERIRLLGLSFQSQGLLDLAFDKFRKLPLNNETKDLIYNLGLEYEKKRLINKALVAYEHINKSGGFRDLDDRIPKLKSSDKSSTLGSYDVAKEASIVSDSGTEGRSMVGRYEILSELGKGSMGLVYKAQDPKINRLVAIKTIRFSDEFDEDVIQEIKERFFREAEIAGKLSHPAIVTIHDVGDDRDLTYMAMEFLEGEDLDKFTNKRNLLPFRRILKVVADIADALDFAHKADVIHRDIKPANVMLLKNGQVKVTDFGIAKAISSSRTKTGVILGTPNYMSPEQIMGQKIDSKSDIFSLGVLFYQLITGELPFHGENLSGLLYQITQVEHPSPRVYNPKIPKVCEQILNKALDKDPNKRFRSAGDMARVINALGEKIDEIKRKKPV